MKKVISKISNNRGSGILYALLALLVVATVSAVIITAAMANTGRVENRVEEEQLYLAAESAAEILSKDWDYNLGSAFVDKGTEWELYWSIEGGESEEEKRIPFASYYHELAAAVLNGTMPPDNKEFLLEFNSEAKNFQNVTLLASLSAPKYQTASGKKLDKDKAAAEFNNLTVIECEIIAANSERTDLPQYSMVITLTPVSQSPYDTTVYANWKVESIKQGAEG